MKSSTMYCHWNEKMKSFCDFHNDYRATSYYGDGKIFRVCVREKKLDENSTYWAWWENETSRFTYCGRMKAMVEICFPYGTKAEEDRGRGKLINVIVEEAEKGV